MQNLCVALGVARGGSAKGWKAHSPKAWRWALHSTCGDTARAGGLSTITTTAPWEQPELWFSHRHTYWNLEQYNLGLPRPKAFVKQVIQLELRWNWLAHGTEWFADVTWRSWQSHPGLASASGISGFHLFSTYPQQPGIEHRMKQLLGTHVCMYVKYAWISFFASFL